MKLSNTARKGPRRSEARKLHRKLLLAPAGAVVHVRRRGWFLIPRRGSRRGPFTSARDALAAVD